MARGLKDLGYKIISGGTDNHLMLIDLRSKFPDFNGREVENLLGLADITITKHMVPFDSRTPFTTSGIRIGTAAITTRGLNEKDCEQVVEWIDYVICNRENAQAIREIKAKVNSLMKGFPLYQ